jgi:hypothetical protein
LSHRIARRAGAAPRLLLRRPVAAAGEDLGAADQKARIDAERPADQAEHHHGADAETSGAAETAAAATTSAVTHVVDIVASTEIIPAHLTISQARHAAFAPNR